MLLASERLPDLMPLSECLKIILLGQKYFFLTLFLNADPSLVVCHNKPGLLLDLLEERVVYLAFCRT